MNRRSGFSGWRLGALVGVTVVALSMGGCPIDLGALFPGIVGRLDVSASASPAATVDKTVQLTAAYTGGTAPYTVAWEQIAGPTVTISDANMADATFVPRAAGFYTFAVTVTDAARNPRQGTATVRIPVGDIQFTVGRVGSWVVKGGNPATISASSNRDDWVHADARVSVFDPEYTDDQTTVMTVTYEQVSVPAGAREQDVELDRDFDTISNQGTGDTDYNTGSSPSLDAVVGIQFFANMDAEFQTLSNIATLIDNYGNYVPGEYVFRATVTNPDGVQRSRDLIVNLLVEGTFGWSDGTTLIGRSAGPATIAVKELPAGSPGRVTNKVMTGDQTATMTVTVFPSTTTSYRFYLLDDNNVPHPDYVAQSDTTVAATDGPHDITLTIGADGGLPIATYRMAWESFDSLGSLNNGLLMVNGTTNVSFHVTDDYLDATMVNAALVGVTSNHPDAPKNYQGWSGGWSGWGPISALADVNLDGALDLITLRSATTIAIRTDGFKKGSTAALRHPDNSGNFQAELPNPTGYISTLTNAQDMAVGDLNGDGLPDIAVSDVVGGVGRVVIFFHTGDPLQPYSTHADQTLVIEPPVYTRQYRADDGDLDWVPVVGSVIPEPDRVFFGHRIAIAPVVGEDTQPDLIITDPLYATLEVYGVPVAGTPGPDILPNDFHSGHQGRVYVFEGGATGHLKPGRPAIVTSRIIETGVTDGTPEVHSVERDETNVMYTAAYTGELLTGAGLSLAAVDSIAVGSPSAIGNGRPFATLTLPSPDAVTRVADNDVVVTTFGGVARIYEFDSDGSGLTVGDVLVEVPAATHEDLIPNAITALVAAIEADDTDRVCTAAVDPKDPNRIIFTSRFSALDELVRGGSGVATTVVNGIATLAQPNQDGAVYRVAANTPTGDLADPLYGIENSSMGLGAGLAMGNVNGTGGNDDLLIAALHSGSDLGVSDGWPMTVGSDDGAVFLVLDGATTLPAPIAGVGADTGDAPPGTLIAPTAVGAALGIGDINGNGLDDVFFTEPGFDRIYLIFGAAAPSDTPDIIFWGVAFDDQAGFGPEGKSLAETGTFLFGDITGDTQIDWLFLDTSLNFGFAGFDR